MVKLKNKAFAGGSVMDVTTNPRSLPTGRSTYLDIGLGNEFFVNELSPSKKLIVSDLLLKVLPQIRKLAIMDDNLSLALNDLVLLTNTGHKIKFDPQVPADQVKRMRDHLSEKSKTWVDGVANMDNFVSKLIAQAYLTGCISNEWVIDNDLKGVKSCIMVAPENIRWVYDSRKQRYFPYQYVVGTNGGNPVTLPKDFYLKLNQRTYKYFAINGFSEVPYGIPPWLPALRTIAKLYRMDENVDNLLTLMGLIGFLEVKVEKPTQEDGESDSAYLGKLDAFLRKTQAEIMKGVSNGVVTGYNDDHNFEFHSTTKDMNGVADLYSEAQRKVANSLKYPGTFMGLKTNGGTETGLSIIFTKMLSQLRAVQSIVAADLEVGYKYELLLAGFKFKTLRVEFNPSTITDLLKTEQAEEYKIRNVSNKYKMGIISQEQAADELGYDAPAQKEPRAPIEENGAQQTREKEKDESDKRTREKNKPQPKVK